jgi:hypothetical protein
LRTAGAGVASRDVGLVVLMTDSPSEFVRRIDLALRLVRAPALD